MASVARTTALRAGGACVRCRKGKTKCVYENGRAPCKNCAKGMHECYLPSESMAHHHGQSPARPRPRESLPSERQSSGTQGGASSGSRHVQSNSDKWVLFSSPHLPPRTFDFALCPHTSDISPGVAHTRHDCGWVSRRRSFAKWLYFFFSFFFFARMSASNVATLGRRLCRCGVGLIWPEADSIFFSSLGFFFLSSCLLCACAAAQWGHTPETYACPRSRPRPLSPAPLPAPPASWLVADASRLPVQFHRHACVPHSSKRCPLRVSLIFLPFASSKLAAAGILSSSEKRLQVQFNIHGVPYAHSTIVKGARSARSQPPQHRQCSPTLDRIEANPIFVIQAHPGIGGRV